jgi:hypothetical protein
MSNFLKSTGIAACLVSISFLTSTAYAADMVEGYIPPAHVSVVHHHYHHHVHPHHRHYPHHWHHHHRLVRTVRLSALDCGKLIYEYRSAPAYKEVKTVCSPPWTGPSTEAETGPNGSSSSTAQ